jgi:cytochrome c oxidase assembly factor CtaG
VSGTGSSPPPFRWSDLWLWHLDWLPCVLLLGALALYLVGVSRTPGWARSRTSAFVAGIVVTFLATQSVIGVYDIVLLSDHMVQHLLLIMVAAPLFACSAPLDLASGALRGRPRRSLDALIDGDVGRVVLHPLFGFVAYAVFIPATHLTSLMNVSMEHPWVHHLEQIAFLVIGYLFFRHVVGIERGPIRLHPGLRMVFLMVAVPVDTFTGLVLAQTSHNPFPYFAMHPRHWGMSILSDVHLGGAIMWIGGDALMLLAMIPTTVRWVRYEERRTRELDAELDAQALASAGGESG